MVKDFGFKAVQIDGVGGQAVLEFDNFGQSFRIGAESLGLLGGLIELLLNFLAVGGFIVAEFVADLGQEFAVEKLGDFVGPGVHDAIDAEVEVGMVQLEHLFE